LFDRLRFPCSVTAPKVPVCRRAHLRDWQTSMSALSHKQTCAVHNHVRFAPNSGIDCVFRHVCLLFTSVGSWAEWPRWFSRSRWWSRRSCSGCLWPRWSFRRLKRLNSAPKMSWPKPETELPGLRGFFLCRVGWGLAFVSAASRREMFHDIHPDCGGDGTRVVCCFVAHHRARERRDMSVGTEVNWEAPGHKPGASLIARPGYPWEEPCRLRGDSCQQAMMRRKLDAVEARPSTEWSAGPHPSLQDQGRLQDLERSWR